MEFEELDIDFLAQKMSENPQSPLFARLADLYIDKKQAVEAIKLSEEGTRLFPNYYAGYLILGKAYLAVKEFSKAIDAFEKTLELSPFNQTAAQLLKSVPNTSDESIRTTDENYFSETPESIEVQLSEPQINQPEPIQELFTPDQTTTFEIEDKQFLESPAKFSNSFDDEPIVQPLVTSFDEPEQTISAEEFPSFDVYFAENQHRIVGEAEKKLDDYLNESQSEQPITTSRDIDPAIYTNTSFETSVTESEVQSEPEPVFSSPEQARLFAEMTGEALPQSDTAEYSSDLDSLAEKLQSAEKIVPQENYQPKTPILDITEEGEVTESDAVTPTLAEIYASQGEFRAAIQAYEILMFSQPAKGGEFQQRIRELQQLQMEKDGLV